MKCAEEFFTVRAGCPFCSEPGSFALSSIRYHDTAEANHELPDIEGRLYACKACGVAFPSHVYPVRAFPHLYRKALKDLSLFDASPLQRARKRYLAAILQGRHRAFSPSRLLDALSLHVFQVPRVDRTPRGLRLLDVGCGFGEFLSIYRLLGNEVTGTEIVPRLVAHVRAQGLDCREGELEEIDFGGATFDVILLRAVFYRMRDPGGSLGRLKRLLAPGGEIALVDPSPEREGVDYFFRKQFPQGQFYILDRAAYFRMLERRYGLACRGARLIYGRPTTPLKAVSKAGNVIGLLELLAANLFRVKPYTLSYSLTAAP